MDLQSLLTKSLDFFIKEKVDHRSLYIHKPNEKNDLHFYCVVINVCIKDKKLLASAVGENLYLTFIKALSELGEGIICFKMNLANRSGLAGGLLRANAIQRAKAELLERDAFLNHYRNLIPFKQSKAEGDRIICELASSDPEFKVFLIVNADYLSSDDTCLIFGMGCDLTIPEAKSKALREYTSMVLSHKVVGGCGTEFMERRGIHRKTDFHHSQSRSVENKHIFKIICNGSASSEIKHFDHEKWTITKFRSPLRFFSFFKACHPDLTEMDFGIEEKFKQFNNLVYHPFW